MPPSRTLRVRLSLGCYALFSSLVVVRGASGLLADPSVAAGLLTAGGSSTFVVGAVGITLPRRRLYDEPPVWAVWASALGILLSTAGFGLLVL